MKPVVGEVEKKASHKIIPCQKGKGLEEISCFLRGRKDSSPSVSPEGWVALVPGPLPPKNADA